MKQKNTGVISQIIGAVIDDSFEKKLPEIYNALTIETNGKELTLEVEQQAEEKIADCRVV